MRGIHVVGGGGHAKVVVGTLQAAGYSVRAAFDDDPRKQGSRLLGVPVEGATREIEKLASARTVLAVGDNASRKRLAERFRTVDWVTVVHPEAFVHPSVRLGPGTVVFAGAVVQPDTVVGAHCIVNTGATVDHDCVLGDYVHVAPGANLAGEVRLDDGVLLGIGGTAAPGAAVGAWTTVGAGSTVIGELSAGVVAVGTPARPVRRASGD
ncbi:acetyltransferase [Rubrobacter taiwanensis]|uniref:Acetyltransferase n=1 Tax=Rubrobacter taiwanensis TaxID=185139 RepID=A0A4R1BNN5_9ACTN|nr:acetyltransferase [Rubrobacter taiwanensis]TCJ18885.1 acetyltransferase [Rubrobacter taiwanensis]